MPRTWQTEPQKGILCQVANTRTGGEPWQRVSRGSLSSLHLPFTSRMARSIYLGFIGAEILICATAVI